MSLNIIRIADAAKKDCRYIIGCLSGTSMDGIDAALFEICGSGSATKFRLITGATYPYPEKIKRRLTDLAFKPETKISDILPLHWQIGEFIADVVNQVKNQAEQMGIQVDFVASHGQTIYHIGEGFENKGSLQIGEADAISTLTGLPVVSDFRQKDIADGGSGAPLACYVDELLFHSREESRIMLNIGGIANITYVPSVLSEKSVATSDTGPGNTLMDTYCKLHGRGDYDKNGDYARKGQVNEKLLSVLLSHPFFSLGIQKSTGQETFNIGYLNTCFENADVYNIDFYSVMATLNMFTARSISDAVLQVCADRSAVIYVNGGGYYNTKLLQNIRMLTKMSVKSIEMLGIKPELKEALLFSVLANEFVTGNGFKSNRGKRKVQFGKLSLP